MIINEIVRPEIRASSKVHIATIELFNASDNTANVRVGDGEPYANVPFSRGASYVHGVEPKIGTPVILSFLGGDMNYPYIVAILNDNMIDPGTGKSFVMPDVTSIAIPAPYDYKTKYYGGYQLY